MSLIITNSTKTQVADATRKKHVRQPFVDAAAHLGQAVLILRRMERLPGYAPKSGQLRALGSVLQSFIAEIEGMGE